MSGLPSSQPLALYFVPSTTAASLHKTDETRHQSHSITVALRRAIGRRSFDVLYVKPTDKFAAGSLAGALDALWEAGHLRDGFAQVLTSTAINHVRSSERRLDALVIVADPADIQRNLGQFRHWFGLDTSRTELGPFTALTVRLNSDDSYAPAAGRRQLVGAA